MATHLVDMSKSVASFSTPSVDLALPEVAVFSEIDEDMHLYGIYIRYI